MKKGDLVLVIDMQNVYTKGQKWECRDMDRVADNILRILQDPRCEQAIFTRYLPAKQPSGVWKEYNKVNREVNEDVFANEMMPQFAEVLKKYPLYTKSVYSSLAIPEVSEAVHQADRVIITGVVAECCVLSTLFALIDEGVYAVYLRDGVAGLDRPKEQATELILSGLAPLHLDMMTVEEYLQE